MIHMVKSDCAKDEGGCASKLDRIWNFYFFCSVIRIDGSLRRKKQESRAPMKRERESLYISQNFLNRFESL